MRATEIRRSGDRTVRSFERARRVSATSSLAPSCQRARARACTCRQFREQDSNLCRWSQRPESCRWTIPERVERALDVDAPAVKGVRVRSVKRGLHR